MKKGFTLIELLVVVLIIGILAAVALPQYTKAVEKSRAAEAMQMLGDIATAESIQFMSTGSYTKDLTAMDMTFPGVDTSDSSKAATNSYDIVVTVGEGTAVGSTTKYKSVSVSATRRNGAYKGGTFTIGLDKDGKIEKGGTLAGGQTAKPADEATGTAAVAGYPSLAPEWK